MQKNGKSFRKCRAIPSPPPFRSRLRSCGKSSRQKNERKHCVTPCLCHLWTARIFLRVKEPCVVLCEIKPKLCLVERKPQHHRKSLLFWTDFCFKTNFEKVEKSAFQKALRSRLETRTKIVLKTFSRLKKFCHLSRTFYTKSNFLYYSVINISKKFVWTPSVVTKKKSIRTKSLKTTSFELVKLQLGIRFQICSFEQFCVLFRIAWK